MPKFSMELVMPSTGYLEGYKVVLRRGWSPNDLRDVSAKDLSLPYVELTTDLENEASQKVNINNGGVFMEEIIFPPPLGGKSGYWWRIALG
jgi:predicted acetyltransferase